MRSNLLEIPADVHDSLLRHLLPVESPDEQAAFLFVRPEEDPSSVVFRLVEWRTVGADGIAHQAPFYLELTEEERARVIKRAHDLGSSVVEMHSHRFPGPATFSGSDRAGLREFVPHVMWRLKRRPYIAVVVAPDSFDGLIWLAGDADPKQLDGLFVGDRVIGASRASLQWWEETDDA